MPNDHADKIKHTEAEITALSDALARLGKDEDLRELLKILHHPGYTTPAEMLFTLGWLKSINVQVKALADAKTDFIAAAKQVTAR